MKLSDLFYKDVRRYRANSFFFYIKRVPRVRFYWGWDHGYMERKKVGLYWSPRSPTEEGDELYRHHFLFYWRPHLSWR